MSKFGWSLPPGCGILPGEEPEDWGLDIDALKKALEGWDTGRWEWDKIDVCLTGKDADLEPWGQQGFRIVSADDNGVVLEVHGYKTEAGNDVCLNEPKGMSEADCDRALDLYLEQAQEIVWGIGSAGEWDGDSWGLTAQETVKVPWVLTRKLGKPSYKRTARACVKAAEKALEGWQREVVGGSNALNQLAGWRNEDDEHLPEGQPDLDGSIFNPLYWGVNPYILKESK